MHHTIIPSVNVFILKGDKVLLGERANTGWMDGSLCPTGGHVEKGETPTVAMLREIKEELSVDVRPEDLEFLCVAVRNNSPQEYVAYEFVIRDKSYDFRNNEPDKCKDLHWVDINNLPTNMIEEFRIIFERSVIGGENYLELGY